MNPDSLPNGGPAYPCDPFYEKNPSYDEYDRRLAQGMSLRDHFAGLAMQAYLSNTDRGDFSYDEWAGASYEMADAMLRARESK